uniref:Uncharacterized protein n=1 Tax=Bombyx mori TaxID=7091 RepID=A0A1W7HGW4_BOMMO|nr:hypothetical protein [Bombyx mori]
MTMTELSRGKERRSRS